ncbi:MAG: BON domain-containing protein [Pirellulales bacterium]|nr:BON domain-containing protein [Pirellulales bacterium]
MSAPLVNAKDVEPRAQLALARSPIYDLRVLRVERIGDALVLSGNVSCFYHKQLAQELIRAVAEGVAVVNAVEVLVPHDSPSILLSLRD